MTCRHAWTGVDAEGNHLRLLYYPILSDGDWIAAWEANRLLGPTIAVRRDLTESIVVTPRV